MQKTIYLAGGCFWGVQKFFSSITGVVETEVGYANGTTAHPTYEDVCQRGTEHAETLRVEYDTDALLLTELLDFFYRIIDPTLLNRQGNDVGSQYRTGIYYTDVQDKPIIEKSLTHLQTLFDQPVVVECKPLDHFYPAEEYHQHYLQKNPNGYCHINLAAMQKVTSEQQE